MEFFDKIGKKASAAYKVTADKTGKLAKETKIRMKIGEERNKVNSLYEEIGKLVYENYAKEERADISKELEEKCEEIKKLNDEIATMLQECLELKDKKQCPNCSKEIDKETKFCPYCGAKQEVVETESSNEQSEGTTSDAENKNTSETSSIENENKDEASNVESQTEGNSEENNNGENGGDASAEKTAEEPAKEVEVLDKDQN